MRDFFRSWRRKAGCIALVLAMAVMAVHLRGHYYLDQIALRLPYQRELEVVGLPNSVRFEYQWAMKSEGIRHPRSTWTWNAYKHDKIYSGWKLAWPEWLKSEWSKGTYGPDGAYSANGFSRILDLPYAIVSLPLALLAAGLIFWKPRSKPKE